MNILCLVEIIFIQIMVNNAVIIQNRCFVFLKKYFFSKAGVPVPSAFFGVAATSNTRQSRKTLREEQKRLLF